MTLNNSHAIKHNLKRLVTLGPRYLTSPIRSMPNFLIIGAQKGGTSSLYKYLIQHPDIISAYAKEPSFFDKNFQKGMFWYKAHFPTYLMKYYKKYFNKREIISGESSTTYIFDPRAAERIYKTIPDVKIIAVLRNPVDRAYSNYQMEIRLGREKLSFKNAIAQESKRVEKDYKKMLNDPSYYSQDYRVYAYIRKGLYYNQLKKWYEIFPRENILILQSESFFSDSRNATKKIFNFLNLSDYNVNVKKRHNYSGGYDQMEDDLRKKLIKFYKPHNKKLYELIGENWDWDE